VLDGQLPSQFPEVAGQSGLRDFLADHIDMQFEDVRAVLRLPQAQALGTTGGGNFLAASALTAIICGASTLFYDAGPHAFQYPYRSQQRFLDVLGYMPWDANASGIQRGAGSKRLWQFARNPLTHAFGVSYRPGKATGHVPNNLQWSLAIVKRGYSVPEIGKLEQCVGRPAFVGVPLRKVASRPDDFVLDVGGLYWAVHRMLHTLFADKTQASRAEHMPVRLVRGWQRP